MSSSKKNNRNRGKRTTATIDLKAKDISSQTSADAPKDKAAGSDAKATDAGSAKPAGDTAPSSTSVDGTAPKDTKPKTAAGKPITADPTDAKKQQGAAGKPKASGAKPSAQTPSPAKGNGGSFNALTHLAAGGLGGLIAIFGVQQFQDAPAPAVNTEATSEKTQALEARLAALETSAKSTSSDNEGKAIVPPELLERISKLESLNETLAGLTEAQNKLTGTTNELNTKVAELSDPSGGGAVELRARLDAMEGTITSLGKAAEGASDKTIPQLAALAGRINDLQTQLEARVDAARKATTDELQGQFTALEAALKATTASRAATDESIATLTSGNKRITLAMETARADMERLSGNFDGVEKRAGDMVARLGKIEAAVAGLDAEVKENLSKTAQSLAARPSATDVSGLVSPIEKKLATVEEQLTSVLTREQSRTNSAKQIVLALELSNLRRALDRGQDVSAEVARIRKSAPESVDLAPLDKLVTSNVPSRAELVSAFGNVSRKILQAESRVEGAGAFEQLLANARSIVRVRKTGDVEGDTTDAIVSRAEDDLKRSDIKSAMTELSKLKGVTAEAASTWMSKARDRLAIDATLEMIETGLKTSVSGATTN